MNYNYFLPCFVSAAAILAAGGALAQQCVQAPSCAELGYTKSASECSGKTVLYCPFDKTKAYCADTDDCASLGFTDTIAQCPGAYSKCPADPTKGKCDFEASPGDLKYSLRTEDHNGWLLCNGRSYEKDKYPELYAAISGSFGTKLPNYTNYFLKGAATSSASFFKTAEQAGLPNITGSFNARQLYDGSAVVSGAFKSGGASVSVTPNSKGDDSQSGFSFDASKSNSIYGRSTTVTPQNYRANVFIYAGRLGTSGSSDTGTQCKEQGYQLIQDGLNQLFCMEGQTLEYCPADNKYGKCVGELDCEALGFTKNPTCSAGQVKLYCLYDQSYAKCTSVGSSTDGCTVGFATLSSANCKSCPNGVKPNGYFSTNGKACYSCCEASSSGIATCYKCYSVNDDLINDDLMNDGLFNSDIMK